MVGVWLYTAQQGQLGENFPVASKRHKVKKTWQDTGLTALGAPSTLKLESPSSQLSCPSDPSPGLPA